MFLLLRSPLQRLRIPLLGLHSMCRSKPVSLVAYISVSTCIPWGRRSPGWVNWALPAHKACEEASSGAGLHLSNGTWGILNIWGRSCKLCAKSLQLCPTLCDPMDCSPPVSSVHGILQVGILEWVAMPSFKESSWARNRACVSYIYLLW